MLRARKVFTVSRKNPQDFSCDELAGMIEEAFDLGKAEIPAFIDRLIVEKELPPSFCNQRQVKNPDLKIEYMRKMQGRLEVVESVLTQQWCEAEAKAEATVH